MASDKSLEKFLRVQFGTEGIKRVVLQQSAPGSSKAAVIDSYEPGDDASIQDMTVLSDEIASRAQSDADGLGGIQRYVVVAYNHDGKAKARHTFRLRGDDDGDSSLAGEESADAKGLLTQLMRHNESNMRTINSSIGMVMRVMGETISTLQAQNEALIQRQTDYAKLREDAESKAHERDVELLKATNEERRRDAMIEKFMLLVPVVVNKFAGKKIIPSDDPSVMMLSSFAESLSQDQVARIFSSLNPEQQIALGQIIQSSRKQIASKTGE